MGISPLLVVRLPPSAGSRRPRSGSRNGIGPPYVRQAGSDPWRHGESALPELPSGPRVAWATGSAATAAPDPRAIAREPTRPTYRADPSISFVDTDNPHHRKCFSPILVLALTTSANFPDDDRPQRRQRRHRGDDGATAVQWRRRFHVRMAGRRSLRHNIGPVGRLRPGVGQRRLGFRGVLGSRR